MKLETSSVMPIQHHRASPRDAGVASAIRPAEFTVTEIPRRDDRAKDVFQRIAARLQSCAAEILGVMIYGSVVGRAGTSGAMGAALGEVQWPVTWVEGAACDGGLLAGVQVFAMSGRTVSRVWVGDRIVGSVFEDNSARHCLLGGLGPAVPTLPRAAQLQQTFAN